jgi:multidrug resistance efflux pump
MAALVALLCVGGFKLWKYFQSYENTDDAQVDGYLDPIGSRINRTVSAVYVDNISTDERSCCRPRTRPATT